jgi:D-alanyl-D-alanine carboxypeptidase
MTENSNVALSDQDKATLRTAAYGAVSLMAAAGAAGGKPHRIATDGSIALSSATGLVGHVLGEKSKAVNLSGKSVAELADQVLPALTEAMSLLKKLDPAEADNFRSTVILATETAIHRTNPSPTVADMIRKITTALDAA